MFLKSVFLKKKKTCIYFYYKIPRKLWFDHKK